MRSVLKAVTFAVAVAIGISAAHAKDTKAEVEVRQFEKTVEDYINSQDFVDHPEYSAKYFDFEGRMRLFDVMAPLEFTGDAFRTHWIQIAQAVSGKVKFHDMVINADKNVAFVSYLQHFVGQDKAGHKFDIEIRTTDGLVKRDGKWMVVHEHLSVPQNSNMVAYSPATTP